MNKIISVFLILVLVLGLASCGASEDGTPYGMKLASNREIVGYSLYVPEDWQVTISNGSTMAQASLNDATSVIVTNHSQAKFNEYSDTKYMLIAYLYGEDEVKLPAAGEEKTYRAYDESLLTKEGTYLNQLYKSFDTVSDADGNVKSTFTMVQAPTFATLNKGDGAVHCITLTSTATFSGAEVRQTMILAYEDEYYFNITFTTSPGLYDTHADTFDTIINNFSFDA